MAKNKQRKAVTLTKSAVQSFVSEAEKRETQSFTSPKGLVLIKNSEKTASWAYRYTNFEGKRTLFRFAHYPALSASEAKDIVIKWQLENIDPKAEAANSRHTLLNASKQAEHRTLGHYLENYYLPHLARHKAAEGGKPTAAIIRRNFEHLLAKDMAQFIKADIHEWQQARLDMGRYPDTVKRAYAALKGLFKHAATDGNGVLESNPLVQIKLMPMDNQVNHEAKEARRAFTPEEAELLHMGLDRLGQQTRQKRANSRAHGREYLQDLSKVEYPHWFIPFTYVAWHTGFRTGDIFSLTWGEVNLRFNRIVITPSKTSFGNTQKPITINMPITPELLKILTAWHKQMGSPVAGLVFPSERTGGQRDKWSHRKPWKKVRELAGLPEEITFYSFRHNFISQLISHNVPLINIAKLSGHKNTRMIEEHYSHLLLSDAQAALAALSGSIGGGAIIPPSMAKNE